MIYKNSDFNANINNETVEVNKKTKTNFYTADKGTAQVRVYVTWNGKKLDLNKYNLVPQLDLFLEDGSIFLNEVITDVDEENGIIYYEVPSNIIVHVGKVDAKLFLKNDNQKVHVANFSFNILDSGVDGKVNKEVSVNLVEDTVRNIIQEEAMDLLNTDFKTEVFEGFQNYVNENVEQFKGPKGDTGNTGVKGEKGDKGDKGDTGIQGPQGVQGVRGPQGLKGDKGDKGEPGLNGQDGTVTFEELTDEQKLELKGEKGDAGVIPNTTNWQKYKLTDDSGILPVAGLGNNLETLRALPTGFYYRSGVPITGASSAAGFVTVWVSNNGLVKHISFKPYNSNQKYIMKYYNTWGDWERIDATNTIVVSSTQPSEAIVWFEVLD